MRAAVIVLAAGEGRRVGARTNKVMLDLAGAPVLAWSLRSVYALEETGNRVGAVLVVTRSEEYERVREMLADEFPGRQIELVAGGATRHESEWKALSALAERIDNAEIEVVAIHDAARPLAGTELFSEVIESAVEHGGAVPVREQDRLVPVDGAREWAGRFVSVQTPQAFRAAALLDAYRSAARDRFEGTDTASCVKRYANLPVSTVASSATNLKITYPEDVVLAERLLAGSAWT